jgi:hypothetical protein
MTLKKPNRKGGKDNKKTETQEKGKKGEKEKSKIMVLADELLASNLSYLMLTPW